MNSAPFPFDLAQSAPAPKAPTAPPRPARLVRLAEKDKLTPKETAAWLDDWLTRINAAP